MIGGGGGAYFVMGFAIEKNNEYPQSWNRKAGYLRTAVTNPRWSPTVLFALKNFRCIKIFIKNGQRNKVNVLHDCVA